LRGARGSEFYLKVVLQKGDGLPCNERQFRRIGLQKFGGAEIPQKGGGSQNYQSGAVI